VIGPAPRGAAQPAKTGAAQASCGPALGWRPQYTDLPHDWSSTLELSGWGIFSLPIPLEKLCTAPFRPHPWQSLQCTYLWILWIMAS